MSNASPSHNHHVWKGACTQKKALSGFEVCQVFANTTHFCLVHSWPSLYRSERCGRKSSSPFHLCSYAPLSSNIHKGTAVCKTWFEGCVGLAYSATNFVRSDSSVTFLWLPITQISNIGAFLLCCAKDAHAIVKGSKGNFQERSHQSPNKYYELNPRSKDSASGVNLDLVLSIRQLLHPGHLTLNSTLSHP